ncbi:CLATHRIN LIGHT CHAIN [Salix purpurea]|uniref:CLATHRIN LIGHT CHAIN n=1 Tax=Salix purpurea TaxID=77065 RepID=A0A9Q0WDU9_SALPP|nr:CLATHRIN LIGHT CHAIN [Salix purpurea]
MFSPYFFDLYLANQEKFHKEADQHYWKAIADIIPREVPNIEKRRGRKDDEKKPSLEDAKDEKNEKDAMDVKGEKDEKSENEGKDAMNGKPPSPTAATADVNKPSKDIAKIIKIRC